MDLICGTGNFVESSNKKIFEYLDLKKETFRTWSHGVQSSDAESLYNISNKFKSFRKKIESLEILKFQSSNLY